MGLDFLSVRTLALAALFLFTGHVGAQSVGEFQRQYQETLRSMSADERAELDRKIASALRYYHGEDYSNALKLLREIAETVETLDTKFWTGISASRLGQYDLAKTKFEEMLALDPSLARVQLELADVLEKMGQKQAARRELRSVMDTDPPASVQRTISRRLARLDAGGERTRTNLGFTLGYQHDDNISSGPDVDSINVGSGILTLPDSQQQLSGNNLLLKGQGGIVHDFADPGGWLWTGNFFTFNSDNDELSEVNYNLVDLRTGLVWTRDNVVVRLPVSYKASWYGNDRLSDTIAFEPGVRFALNERWSMDFTATLAEEEFDNPRYTNVDNDLWRFAVSPTAQLGERTSLMLQASVESRDAASDVFSYDGYAVSAMLSQTFGERTSAFFSVRYSERDFDLPAPLFQANREDDRTTVTAALNRRILDNWNLMLSYSYMDNSSNTGLYDFDRSLYSIEFGYQL